jgi:hypothetical protein
MCWSFNPIGYCGIKLMFTIIYISKQNEEYIVTYSLEKKENKMRVSAGMVESLNPQQLFLLLRRIATDQAKQANKGKLVKEWN